MFPDRRPIDAPCCRSRRRRGFPSDALPILDDDDDAAAAILFCSAAAAGVLIAISQACASREEEENTSTARCESSSANDWAGRRDGPIPRDSGSQSHHILAKRVHL